MILQKCTNKDLNTLTELAQKTYREHYQYLWKDKGEQYIKSNYNKAAFQKELADKNVAVFLILQEEEVYGFLKLNINAALNEYSAKEGLELERIYLLKKATGKGLGKAVIQAVDELAKNLNKKVIWLKTMDSSGADVFYQKCGYEICGETILKLEGIYPNLQRQLIMNKYFEK